MLASSLGGLRQADVTDGQAGGVILTVCTANICRSPAAELLLRAEFERSGVQGLSVKSAGTRSPSEAELDPEIAGLLEADGISAGTFRSRRIDVENVNAADVILTATTEHRTQVVQLAPSALSKTFTMLEFGMLGQSFEQQPARNAVEQLERARAAALEQRAYRLLDQNDLSIDDPYGCSRSVYTHAYDQLRAAMSAVAALFVDPLR